MAKVVKTAFEVMMCKAFKRRLGKALVTAEVAEVVSNYLHTSATATTRGVGRRKLLQYLSARDAEVRAKKNTDAKLARLRDAIEHGEVSGYKLDDTHTIYTVRDGGKNRCVVRTEEKSHIRVDWAAFAKAMGYTADHAICMGCITTYRGSDTIKEAGTTAMDDFIKAVARQLDENDQLYDMVKDYVLTRLATNE